MPVKFETKYNITPKIASCLMRIEAAKGKVVALPVTLTPMVLSVLRETARLYTTYYSTMIEGNTLSYNQVKEVLKHDGHFSGHEHYEKEVKGYYRALSQAEEWGTSENEITENMMQMIHALVMSDGKLNVKPIPYRDGQNVIRDGKTKAIIYMPPEAKDVSELMHDMIGWVNESIEIPCPIVAGIAHYQFATIHPYYDGNGRTARLLTTMILHLGGYDLKGLYSLEEYYANNLGAYYEAIGVGGSNYYKGRAKADITSWIEYFTEGMVVAFESALERIVGAKGKSFSDRALIIRKLDMRQRRALELFQEFETVTSSQIGKLFGFKPRTNAQICSDWVKKGFLEIVDPSYKGRRYKLAKKYEDLILDKYNIT